MKRGLEGVRQELGATNGMALCFRKDECLDDISYHVFMDSNLSVQYLNGTSFYQMLLNSRESKKSALAQAMLCAVHLNANCISLR